MLRAVLGALASPPPSLVQASRSRTCLVLSRQKTSGAMRGNIGKHGQDAGSVQGQFRPLRELIYASCCAKQPSTFARRRRVPRCLPPSPCARPSIMIFRYCHTGSPAQSMLAAITKPSYIHHTPHRSNAMCLARCLRPPPSHSGRLVGVARSAAPSEAHCNTLLLSCTRISG